MKLTDQYILVVSNEPWSDVWFSKHNYAWELAKNNKVYFVNSPAKWKFSNLFGNNFKVAVITEKLSVVDIQNRFPSKFRILKELNNFIASQSIRKKLPGYQKNKFILWTFTPLFLFKPELLKLKLSIFHIVDKNWTGFYGTSHLAEKADILIIVSETILDEYKKYRKKSLVIGHAISEDEFNFKDEDRQSTNKELSKYGDFGLFVGSLDHRIDYKFIERLANECPDRNFVFVGPNNLPVDHPYRFLFDSKKNIIALGKRHYKELKYYIRAAAFCISPMDFIISGNNIAHHKTLPYLAQGKMIFGPVFSDYKNYQELMTLEDDQDKLIEGIKNFKGIEDPEIIQRRINLAKNQLYTGHLDKIEIFVNSLGFENKS